MTVIIDVDILKNIYIIKWLFQYNSINFLKMGIIKLKTFIEKGNKIINSPNNTLLSGYTIATN